MTYEICGQFLDDLVTVNDDEIAAAILKLMEDEKVVAEGAGAGAEIGRASCRERV